MLRRLPPARGTAGGIAEAGLEVTDPVSVEGPAFILGDLIATGIRWRTRPAKLIGLTGGRHTRFVR